MKVTPVSGRPKRLGLFAFLFPVVEGLAVLV